MEIELKLHIIFRCREMFFFFGVFVCLFVCLCEQLKRMLRAILLRSWAVQTDRKPAWAPGPWFADHLSSLTTPLWFPNTLLIVSMAVCFTLII